MSPANDDKLQSLLSHQGSIAERYRIARELDDGELQLAAPHSAEAKEELDRRRHERLLDSRRPGNPSSAALTGDPLAELAFGPLPDVDSVTGLRTRNAFQTEFARFAEVCERAGVPLACLIIDVDDFKHVNDTYGHPQGDRVLHEIAACALSAARGKGRAYRYGGDEFAIVFANFTAEDAHGVGERIRRAVDRLNLEGVATKVGVTIGVASTSSGHCTSDELLNRADQALLAAKSAGKGRVAVFADEPSEPSQPVAALATADEVQPLAGWLESESVEVRRDAAHELANLAASKRLFPLEAIRPLPRRLLKDPDPQVRMLGLQTIAAIAAKDGEQATGYYTRPLVEVVETDRDLDVRARAIATIGLSGDVRFLERICDWIANWEQGSYTRVHPIAALIGLAQRHRARVIESLRRRADAAGTDQQRIRFAEALREVRSIGRSAGEINVNHSERGRDFTIPAGGRRHAFLVDYICDTRLTTDDLDIEVFEATLNPDQGHTLNGRVRTRCRTCGMVHEVARQYCEFEFANCYCPRGHKAWRARVTGLRRQGGPEFTGDVEYHFQVDLDCELCGDSFARLTRTVTAVATKVKRLLIRSDAIQLEIEPRQEDTAHIVASRPASNPPMAETLERTVVVVDLARYSDIAWDLEAQLGPVAVAELNKQIESMVTKALTRCRLRAEQVPRKSTGDGAILLLESATVGVAFAEALHRVAAERNRDRPSAITQRHFRVGVFNDVIVVSEHRAIEVQNASLEFAGTAVSNAVRLQGACGTGEILISANTSRQLPDDIRMSYGPEEQVSGKRAERFTVHRKRVVPPAPWDVDAATQMYSLGVSADRPPAATERWARDDKFHAILLRAIPDLLRTLPVPIEDIGLHVWLARHIPELQGERLARVARLRLSDSTPSPRRLWSRGEGVVGRCWTEQTDVPLNLTDRKYVDCTAAKWDELDSESRMGMSFIDFRETTRHFSAIFASPIVPDEVAFGCVSLNVDRDVEVPFEALWTPHTKRILRRIAADVVLVLF